MTELTTVVQFPEEPVPIYVVEGKGFIVDPHVPLVTPPQPMIGGRLLYIDGNKIKALPVASP